MADTKISALTDGGALLPTDSIPVERAGGNAKAKLLSAPKVTGARAAGNTDYVVWDIDKAAGRTNEAAFQHIIGGATFDGEWDPVSYMGYNVDNGDPTEPTVRWCIEGNYFHGGVRDFEVYLEYISVGATVTRRPIFIAINKATGDTSFGLNQSTISVQPTNGAGSGVSGSTQFTLGGQSNFLMASGSGSMLGLWSQDVGRTGIRIQGSTFPNGIQSHLGLYAEPGTPAANSVSNSVCIFTAPSGSPDAQFLRYQARHDGKHAWYTSYGSSGTDYERLTLNPTAGVLQFVAESAGTGTANITLQLTPKGTGVVQADTAIQAPRGDSSTGGYRFIGQPSAGLFMQQTNLGGGSNVLVLRSTNGNDMSMNGGTVRLGSGILFGFASGDSAATNLDTAFSRNAAGVFEINNGTAGTFRDVKLRSVIQVPPSTITPASNGDLVFEATSNTTVTVKMRGSDGTVRSAALTLA